MVQNNKLGETLIIYADVLKQIQGKTSQLRN